MIDTETGIVEGNLESQKLWDLITESYSKRKSITIMGLLMPLANVLGSQKILDVGCGAGEATKLLGLQSPKPSLIYGLDFCGEMIKKCEENLKNYEDFNCNPNNSLEIKFNSDIKKRINVDNEFKNLQKGTHIKFIQGDCENLPFENDQFDCYISSLCLHLTNDYKNALKECYRVIRKGGYFAVAVWGKRDLNTEQFANEICVKHGFKDSLSPRYEMAKNPDEVVEFCKKVGFSLAKYHFCDLMRMTPQLREIDINMAFDIEIRKKLEELKIKDSNEYNLIIKEVKEALNRILVVEKKKLQFKCIFVIWH